MRRYTDTVQITGIATAGPNDADDANSNETANKHDGGGMKEKLILFAAKILWWVITGRRVNGERPIDVAIRQHKGLLVPMTHEERSEILCALINWQWPGKHIHANPRKKAV